MSTPANAPGPRSTGDSVARASAGAGAAPDGSHRPRTGRSWGVVLGVVLALLLAVAGAVVVYTVPVFSVDHVEVTGNQRIADEDIRAAAQVPEGENLLRVDTVAAASGVVADPWIDRATVHRSLPSTLVIDVTERTAVAWIDTPEGTTLIDASGTPFIREQPPAEAIHVTGSAIDDDAVLEGAVDIAGSLTDELRTRIESLDADDPYTYTLLLDDGRRVFWGESADNENKALALETVVQREGGEWDISNPSLVTVR